MPWIVPVTVWAAAGLPAREIGEDAMAALQAYEWPGNARQLRNVIEWLLIMAPGDPGTPVLVKADERVPYGSVVRGMVLLQKAGATKIGFLTDPKAVRALEEIERKR